MYTPATGGTQYVSAAVNGGGTSVDYDGNTMIVSADRPKLQLASAVIGSLTLYQNLQDLFEVGSNLTKFAQLGRAGEAAARQLLISRGYTILDQQLYVRTSLGVRITDFVITGGVLGDDIAGYEVKVNNSAYTPLQQQKDAIIQSFGGTVASRFSPVFSYGQTIQYPTYLLGVQTP